MKKKTRLIMVIVALFVAVNVKYVTVSRAQSIDVDKATDIGLKVAESGKNEDVQKTSCNLFTWCKDVAGKKEIIGTISSDKFVTALAATDQDEDILLRACGINPKLSDENHLTIVGHNTQNALGQLKGKLFTRLKELKPGDTITLDTEYGQYKATVTFSEYVTIEEYEKDSYKILLNGDISLASCEWDKEGVKGRHVVFAEVEK